MAAPIDLDDESVVRCPDGDGVGSKRVLAQEPCSGLPGPQPRPQEALGESRFAPQTPRHWHT